jgi:hypothetical protein
MRKVDVKEGRLKESRCLGAMDMEKTAQNTMDSKNVECSGE